MGQIWFCTLLEHLFSFTSCVFLGNAASIKPEALFMLALVPILRSYQNRFWYHDENVHEHLHNHELRGPQKKIPESPLGILQSSSVAKFFVSFHKNHKLTI